MKFDPPMLVRGPLSGAVFVVTHGKLIEREGKEPIVHASVKYDVTDQFKALVDGAPK